MTLEFEFNHLSVNISKEVGRRPPKDALFIVLDPPLYRTCSGKLILGHIQLQPIR